VTYNNIFARVYGILLYIRARKMMNLKPGVTALKSYQ